MRVKFTAGTKYNEMKGTAAADTQSHTGLKQWLEGKGLLKDGQNIIGVSIHTDEVTHQTETNITFRVVAYVTELDRQILDLPNTLKNGVDDSVLTRIETEMSPNQFFLLYKRFEIAISSGQGLMDGVPLNYSE